MSTIRSPARGVPPSHPAEITQLKDELPPADGEQLCTTITAIERVR